VNALRKKVLDSFEIDQSAGDLVEELSRDIEFELKQITDTDACIYSIKSTHM